MWWIITFPNRARRFMDNAGKIHIFQSLVAWGVPSLLVAAIVANDGYAYRPIDIKFCFGAGRRWTYFTYILPHQIVAAIGISLLIWTCFQLRRKVRFQSLREFIFACVRFWSVFSSILFAFATSFFDFVFFPIFNIICTFACFVLI